MDSNTENSIIKLCYEGKKEIWFDALEIDGEKAWVFANDFNGLFEVDLKTLKTTYLGSIPGEPFLRGSLCYSIVKVENDLVLLPAGAKRVAIYNLLQKAFSFIEMRRQEDSIYGAVAIGRKVYFLVSNAPMIGYVDMDDYSIHYFCEIEKHKMGRPHINGRICFRKGICAVGETVYCVSCDDNEVIQINTKDGRIKFFELDGVEDGLRSIAYDGNIFWITEWGRASLVQWDERYGVQQVFRCKEYRNLVYRSADLICNNDIWIFPTGGDLNDDALVFDPERKIWRTIPELLKFGSRANVKKNPWKQIFPVSVYVDDGIYTYAANTGEFLFVDWTGHVKSGVLMAKMTIQELRTAAVSETGLPVFKEEEMGIVDFLNYLLA